MSGQKTGKVTLRVGGMSCASCVATIEGALSNLKGVSKAQVNFAAQKAQVEYDPAETNLEQVARTIEDVGYEVVPDELSLSVFGMRSAHCEDVVKEGLENLPGVVRAEPNSSTETAYVWYHGGIVSPAEIKDMIRDLGYDVEEKLEGGAALDREREARQREIRRQGLWMVLSWSLALIVMLGTFKEYWILPEFVPEFLGNKFTLFVFTTPVVFGPGLQFFINSWRGLKHGVTDMNLLYATGIGAAYLIGVVNTFWPDAGFGGERAVFFESAAFLTAFIVLGKWLEALTRGRTSDAI